jgi:hypothetical protein
MHRRWLGGSCQHHSVRTGCFSGRTLVTRTARVHQQELASASTATMAVWLEYLLLCVGSSSVARSPLQPQLVYHATALCDGQSIKRSSLMQVLTNGCFRSVNHRVMVLRTEPCHFLPTAHPCLVMSVEVQTPV